MPRTYENLDKVMYFKGRIFTSVMSSANLKRDVSENGHNISILLDISIAT